MRKLAETITRSVAADVFQAEAITVPPQRVWVVCRIVVDRRYLGDGPLVARDTTKAYTEIHVSTPGALPDLLLSGNDLAGDTVYPTGTASAARGVTLIDFIDKPVESRDYVNRIAVNGGDSLVFRSSVIGPQFPGMHLTVRVEYRDFDATEFAQGEAV